MLMYIVCELEVIWNIILTITQVKGSYVQDLYILKKVHWEFWAKHEVTYRQVC